MGAVARFEIEQAALDESLYRRQGEPETRRLHHRLHRGIHQKIFEELIGVRERQLVHEIGHQRAEDLLAQFKIFAGLGAAELKALARLLRPRLLVPGEVVIRKGERGHAMFLISSGALEVVLPNAKVRLGSGDFVGEMALLSGRPRQADVIALGYCRVLVLGAADFRRFLRNYPQARAEIRRVAAARARANEEKEAV
jgi:Cyclic nucleotide-binding domain